MAQWYYGLNGKQEGPVEEDEVRAMLASGMINGQTIVWREGMAAWTPAGEVAELGEAFKKVPPPLPPQKSGPPPLPAQR